MPSSDAETDSGYRSRSQSRRARRKKTTTKGKPAAMGSVPEDSLSGNAPSAKQAELQHQSNHSAAYTGASAARQQEADALGMQPFEWIGPDSTSMSGPVTYARAMRGEIPMRPGNPNQSLATGYKPPGGEEEGEGAKDPLMEADGLKLRLELNLDIEIELKARIHGDLTISLL